MKINPQIISCACGVCPGDLFNGRLGEEVELIFSYQSLFKKFTLAQDEKNWGDGELGNFTLTAKNVARVYRVDANIDGGYLIIGQTQPYKPANSLVHVPYYFYLHAQIAEIKHLNQTFISGMILLMPDANIFFNTLICFEDHHKEIDAILKCLRNCDKLDINTSVGKTICFFIDKYKPQLEKLQGVHGMPFFVENLKEALKCAIESEDTSALSKRFIKEIKDFMFIYIELILNWLRHGSEYSDTILEKMTDMVLKDTLLFKIYHYFDSTELAENTSKEEKEFIIKISDIITVSHVAIGLYNNIFGNRQPMLFTLCKEEEEEVLCQCKSGKRKFTKDEEALPNKRVRSDSVRIPASPSTNNVNKEGVGVAGNEISIDGGALLPNNEMPIDMDTGEEKVQVVEMDMDDGIAPASHEISTKGEAEVVIETLLGNEIFTDRIPSNEGPIDTESRAEGKTLMLNGDKTAPASREIPAEVTDTSLSDEIFTEGRIGLSSNEGLIDADPREEGRVLATETLLDLTPTISAKVEVVENSTDGEMTLANYKIPIEENSTNTRVALLNDANAMASSTETPISSKIVLASINNDIPMVDEVAMTDMKLKPLTSKGGVPRQTSLRQNHHSINKRKKRPVESI